MATLLMVAFAVGCPSSDLTATFCINDDDCPNGPCEEGRCVEAPVDAAAEIDVEAADIGRDFNIQPIDVGEPDIVQLGQFGDPCEYDNQCYSGYCITTTDGRYCTQLCIDVCPFGFECRLLTNTGADAVRICVPEQAINCLACEIDLDCGDLNARCLQQDNGYFCASDCSSDRACPDNFVCNPMTLVGAGPGGEDVDAELCEPIYGACLECADDLGSGVDLSNSPDHCGECGASCYPDTGESAQCIDGICDRDCLPDYYNFSAIEPGCETHCLINEDTGGEEICNFIDDNCSGLADEGFDTQNDPAYCGDCQPCALQHTIEHRCESGVCRSVECEENWGSCDGEPENGCEASLFSLSHCGSCNDPCAFDNAAESCPEGTCLMGACEDNYDDCDDWMENGCEASLLEDEDHCGSCFNDCINPNGTTQCVAGVCTPVCDEDWGNCDDVLENGCEQSLATLTHCEFCDTPCSYEHSGETCATGTCQPTDCADNWGDCDADPDCETPLTTLTDCGDCGDVCNLSHASETCATGTCQLVLCDDNYSNCDSLVSTGCEASLLDDELHCGACDNQCTNGHGSTSCIAGACTPICNDGYKDCDGDPDNGCETNIWQPTSCGSGCDDRIDCNELDEVASATCSAGVCGISLCNEGYAHCDTSVLNGCETNLDSLLTCGTSCGDLTSCIDGDTCTADSCLGGSCSNPAHCSGTNSSCGCSTCANCTSLNGWTNVISYPCCDGIQACTCQDQEFRTYSCVGTGCTYAVTDERTIQSGCSSCNDGSSCTSDSCSGGSCNNSPNCSGTDTSCGCTSCSNCDSYDGWYNSGFSRSCCSGGQACTCQDQQYRNYSCSGTSCTYSVTSTDTVVSSCSTCNDWNSCTADSCSGGSCTNAPYCSGTSSSCGCTSCTNCNGYPNVNSTSCSGTSCVINSCDAYWGNYDGSVTNGCECNGLSYEPNNYSNYYYLGSFSDCDYSRSIWSNLVPSSDNDFFVLYKSDDWLCLWEPVVRLRHIPAGTDYDLYFYTWNGSSWDFRASSIAGGNADEYLNLSGYGTGYWGFKITRFSGTSCSNYEFYHSDG